MAFDGIITRAVVAQLKATILNGRIDKVYQPEKEDMVIHVRCKGNNVKLFASASGSGAGVYITEEQFDNPDTPSGFCMLMRKSIQGGTITDIRQYGSERIIEISISSPDELGIKTDKRLICEIMGRHSNIILVNENNKVIECIKRISIDTSSVRPMFPGRPYTYPPRQDKISFDHITRNDFNKIPKERKAVLSIIGGISPSIAEHIALSEESYDDFKALIAASEKYPLPCHIYTDDNGDYKEFHIENLYTYEGIGRKITFEDVSRAISSFYQNREGNNRTRNRSKQILSHLSSLLDKAYLKLQRLKEDLSNAENADTYRLYGELLTANLHLVKSGDSKVKVISYYDGTEVVIPLDPRYSPSKNAQIFYKKFAKSKIAVKEKQIQIEETDKDIEYLESVYLFLSSCSSSEEIDQIRQELTESGYIKSGKSGKHGRTLKFKPSPLFLKSPCGYDILIGKNNRENDYITFKLASKGDTWFHTKNIPGSHVILRNAGHDVDERDMVFAAEIAAFYSKGKLSGKVPVDYTAVKNLKKPKGAKPGMVIFHENNTLWATPSSHESDDK